MGAGDNSCRVWVGGLPSDIKEREVEDRFSDFGEVTEVHKRTTEKDTFCFVQYRKIEAAEYAIRQMDQTQFCGKRIKVAAASNGPPRGGKGDGRGNRRDSRERQDRDRNGGRPEERRERTDDRRPPSRKRSRSRRKSPSVRKRSRTPPPARPRSRSPPAKRVESPPRRSPPRRSRSRGGRVDDRARSKVEEGAFKVTVEFLPSDMSWHELKDLGRNFGNSLTFARTYRNRHGDYCGMVEYKYRDDADNCVRELDRRRVEGCEGRLRAYHGDSSKEERR